MTESVDLFHAMQHMKYARGKLKAYLDKRDRDLGVPPQGLTGDDLVGFDIRELDAMIERTKLTLDAIKEGTL